MNAADRAVAAYVDDKPIRAWTWDALDRGLELTHRFDRLAGQHLNFENSRGMATSKSGEQTLRRQRINDQALTIF